ncbi:alpha/beta fold hydrolase [Nocardioides albidus]|uniref:Alpha/beta fold hydrolase n=1 Tax=Nocardioides albidus TaxID=1517589 RepID=A0A5C4VJU6_9ACTN|nr:alpha/beta fold hydrolase [Nocardioides albidus]TNM36180.1 alpha/beta fold hydrolase [Nocardioides albidus]
MTITEQSPAPDGIIHVDDTGSGPTILCLHGIGSSSASFAPQREALADEFRILAWDAPGYGRSADVEAGLDLDGYADAAAAVIEQHAAGGPVHVLGVSWGGVIAVRLASRHPHLLRSLVVADSSRGSAVDPDKAAAMRERAEQLAEQGNEAFAAARGPRLVSPAAPPELVDRVVAGMRDAIRLPGYAQAAEVMAATDLTEELGKVDLPTLVLCGDQDQVTGIAESQALAGGIPDAVFVTLRGAGHLANQESPEAFNAWLSSFVSIVERLYG